MKVGDILSTDHYGCPKAYVITRMTQKNVWGKKLILEFDHSTDPPYNQDSYWRVTNNSLENEHRLGTIHYGPNYEYVKMTGPYGSCLFHHDGGLLHDYSD